MPLINLVQYTVYDFDYIHSSTETFRYLKVVGTINSLYDVKMLKIMLNISEK